MSKLIKGKIGLLIKEQLEPKGFKLVKSQYKLIKILDNGAQIIKFKLRKRYDEAADKIVTEVIFLAYIRFDVIHDWFLPYETRTSSDLKFNWTTGLEVWNLEIEKRMMNTQTVHDLSSYVSKVLSAVEGYFKSNLDFTVFVNKELEKREKRGVFDLNIAVENLTMIWLLRRNEFETTKADYLERLQKLYEKGDPMVRKCLPQFDEMIKSLKSYDYPTLADCNLLSSPTRCYL